MKNAQTTSNPLFAKNPINPKLLQLIATINIALIVLQILMVAMGNQDRLLVFLPSILIYLVALYLNTKGYYVTAAKMVLGTSVLHTLAISLLFFTPTYGLHMVLLGLMPSVFVLLPKKEQNWIFGCISSIILTSIIIEAQWLKPLYPIVLASKHIVMVNLINTTVSAVTSTAIIYMIYLSMQEQQSILAIEHQRSEELLHNLFPPSVVLRLKQQERTIADLHEHATVIFADIVGFTEMSAKYSPNDVLRTLNKCFGEFDKLAHSMDIEKIKTIGDAYMAVAGVPYENPHHIEDAFEFACQMLLTMEKIQHLLPHPLQIRIGIHTGPVIAGVIGRKKSIYDLWGDTVNTASRMETLGVPSAIHVTKKVYEALHTKYPLRSRGSMMVKGKGEMETYVLHLDDLHCLTAPTGLIISRKQIEKVANSGFIDLIENTIS